MTTQGIMKLPQEWRLELADDELRRVAVALHGEIERGLEGKKHRDLATLPAFVGMPRRSTRGKAVCLDVGGTLVRAAAVRVDGSELEVGEVKQALLPGVREPVDRKAFFGVLAELVQPLLGRLRRIGFCFSYPAKILPDGDAVLLRWTKEVRAAGVEGTRVGKGLQEALRRLGRKGEMRVAVVNDTVTTLLAATRDPETEGCVGFVGLVVGTGTNMACFEPGTRAKSVPKTWRGLVAFNLESGNFKGFPRGTLDERLAAETLDPDRQWFEKAVAGQYLGELARIALQDLVSRGKAPAELGTSAQELGPLTSRAMARILSGASPESPWEEWLDDHPEALAVARAVMRAVVERSARLVAAGLACLVERAAHGASRHGGEVAIAAEGSAFYGLPRYREIVEETLQRLTNVRFRIVRVPNANLKGAALAVLTQADHRS